jgi:hypothetical protein
MLRTLKIRHLAPVLVIIAALVALTGAQASAAPSALKFKPKNPIEGQKVTVTATGYKKKAKYKIIVNDKTYKRSYKTSKHGKVKFSFKMPGIPVGQAIFIAIKQGKRTAIAEVFIGETPAATPGATKEACESSPYPPLEDGTCYDWSLDNGIEDEGPDENDPDL